MLTMHADVCSHPTTLQSIIVALQTAVDSRNCLGDVKKGEKNSYIRIQFTPKI